MIVLFPFEKHVNVLLMSETYYETSVAMQCRRPFWQDSCCQRHWWLRKTKSRRKYATFWSRWNQRKWEDDWHCCQKMESRAWLWLHWPRRWRRWHLLPCHITDGNALEEGSKVTYDESADERSGKMRADNVLVMYVYQDIYKFIEPTSFRYTITNI